MDSKLMLKIASVCHEANAAWCRANGDMTQTSWEEAPQWQKDSAMVGVGATADGTTPQDLHDLWMQDKLDSGWKYGMVKDREKKTHPCMVAYDELSEHQRLKDNLFVAIVNALK